MSKDLSSNSSEAYSAPNLHRATKAIALIFGVIGLFFIGQILGVYLIVAIMAIFGKDTSSLDSLLTDNAAMQFVTIFCIEVITLGSLWWLHHLRKQGFLKAVGLGTRPKPIYIVFAAATYGLYFLTLLVTVAITTKLVPGLNVDQAQELGFDSAKGLDLIFVFLTLVVLPPIVEEILFRGFLFSRLRIQIGLYAAAIATSSIFALAHTEFLGDNPLNWIAALDTFVFSFFLIFLYVKSKSLWPSIFLHAFKNCLAFVLLFLIKG